MQRTLLAWMLTASAAIAHPGHDEAARHGAAHWLFDLDHLAVVVPAALLIWLVLDARPRTALRRWLARD